MLTYADAGASAARGPLCATDPYADVCWRMQVRMLTYADVCRCERGARTVGCDRSFTFSSGSRANLDFLGMLTYANVC
jgi:hypothetical protein